MIKVTFPDGSVREYESGVTGLEIARSISERLAQEVLAASVNGKIYDLTRPITEDCAFKLHKWEDAEAKETFWHTSAHILGEALQQLYPGIQFGIGPAIENGFYYDVDPGEGVSISEADLEKIENKMRELAAAKETLQRKESGRIRGSPPCQVKRTWGCVCASIYCRMNASSVSSLMRKRSLPSAA